MDKFTRIKSLIGYAGQAEIVEIFAVTHGGFDKSFHPTEKDASRRRDYEKEKPRFMDEGPDQQIGRRVAIRFSDAYVFVLYEQSSDVGYNPVLPVKLEIELPESSEQIREIALAKLTSREKGVLGLSETKTS